MWTSGGDAEDRAQDADRLCLGMTTTESDGRVGARVAGDAPGCQKTSLGVCVSEDNPRTAEEQEGPVVVGVNGSLGSRAALAWAAVEAADRGVDLTLLHAADPGHGCGTFGQPERVAPGRPMPQSPGNVLAEAVELAERIRPRLAVRALASTARPAEALLTASWRAALVVVGAREASALTRGALEGHWNRGLHERERHPAADQTHVRYDRGGGESGLPGEPAQKMISRMSPRGGGRERRRPEPELWPWVMLVGDTGLEPVTSTVSR